MALPLGDFFREPYMPFLQLVLSLLHLYEVLVIIQVVMTLLFQFNIMNRSNEFVNNVYFFLCRIVDPALRKIRQYVKPMNGIDFSPLILLLGLELLYNCIVYYVMPYFARHGI